MLARRGIGDRVARRTCRHKRSREKYRERSVCIIRNGNRALDSPLLPGNEDCGYRYQGQTIGKETALELLGPPDLSLPADGAGRSAYAYFYDRFSKRDWVVYVSLQSNLVCRFTYNDASVNDHSYWKKCDSDVPPQRW